MNLPVESWQSCASSNPTRPNTGLSPMPVESMLVRPSYLLPERGRLPSPGTPARCLPSILERPPRPPHPSHTSRRTDEATTLVPKYLNYKLFLHKHFVWYYSELSPSPCSLRSKRFLLVIGQPFGNCLS